MKVSAILGLVLVALTVSAPAQGASVWRTVSGASDVSDYATVAYFSKTASRVHASRLRVHGPGVVKISGSVTCNTAGYARYGSRSFGFSIATAGVRSLPQPVGAINGAKCSYYVMAEGGAGTLELALEVR